MWSAKDPSRLALTGLHTANALAEQVARSTDGILWDPTTQEAFSADAWHKRRVDGWNDDVPEAAKQIAVFGTPRDGLLRAATAGMAKFGVPDLVVDGYPPAMHGKVSRLIGLVAQTIAEGAAVGKRGELTLDVASIRHSHVRQRARWRRRHHAPCRAWRARRHTQPNGGDYLRRWPGRFARRPHGKGAVIG